MREIGTDRKNCGQEEQRKKKGDLKTWLQEEGELCSQEVELLERTKGRELRQDMIAKVKRYGTKRETKREREI